LPIFANAQVHAHGKDVLFVSTGHDAQSQDAQGNKEAGVSGADAACTDTFLK
jgi:hypothetical protein